MIEPRQELAAAELGGVIYAVGGLVGSATANEVYDPVNDRWSVEADFPVATDHAWAVAFEGLLYVGGGSSNRVFSYDPATDDWNEVASSAFVHGGTPAAAVLNGRIVVAGGAGGGMAGNEVEAYDPLTDQWSLLAPMSCARNHTAGGVIGGKFYVAGWPPQQPVLPRSLRSRHGRLDQQSSDADRPLRNRGCRDCGLLLCFGGEGNPDDPNGIFHEVEAYDPATDEWTRCRPCRRASRHLCSGLRERDLSSGRGDARGFRHNRRQRGVRVRSARGPASAGASPELARDAANSFQGVNEQFDVFPTGQIPWPRIPPQNLRRG